MKPRKKNPIDVLIKKFGVDSIVCEDQEDSGVLVTPYDSKSKKWYKGMVILTNWDEIRKSAALKFLKEKDSDELTEMKNL